MLLCKRVMADSRLQIYPLTSKRAIALVVQWLNAPTSATTHVVKQLVDEARLVLDVLDRFTTQDDLVAARKSGEVPKGFRSALGRLNATLGEFKLTPLVDPNFFYDGERVAWGNSGDVPGLEVRCVLQLIEAGLVTKLRTCDYCPTWYFARLGRQRFCSSKCRWNAFANDEEFKAERNRQARENYRYKHRKHKHRVRKG